MAVTKAKKAEQIEKLNQDLQKASSMIVGTFSKLTVAKDFELRKTVRAAGGSYRVVKNNLAEIASEGTPAAEVLKGLRGMTSLVYTSGDPVALAKALTTYAKTNPTFTFKAGMVEGRAIDIRAINDLANMPSREEILARLLFLINAPATQLAQVINAVGRNLAVVVDQGTKENKFKA
jgi:large subunit ribosomal protein L10